jgi:hypothetical protein
MKQHHNENLDKPYTWSYICTVFSTVSVRLLNI